MKTLEQIKEEVAKDHLWDSYDVILASFRNGAISFNSFNDYLDDLAKAHAEQAVNEALRMASDHVKKAYKDSGLTNTGERIAESILLLAPEIIANLK